MSSDAILIYRVIWPGTTVRGAIPNTLITFLKREYLWDLAVSSHSRYAA